MLNMSGAYLCGAGIECAADAHGATHIVDVLSLDPGESTLVRDFVPYYGATRLIITPVSAPGPGALLDFPGDNTPPSVAAVERKLEFVSLKKDPKNSRAYTLTLRTSTGEIDSRGGLGMGARFMRRGRTMYSRNFVLSVPMAANSDTDFMLSLPFPTSLLQQFADSVEFFIDSDATEPSMDEDFRVTTKLPA